MDISATSHLDIVTSVIVGFTVFELLLGAYVIYLYRRELHAREDVLETLSDVGGIATLDRDRTRHWSHTHWHYIREINRALEGDAPSVSSMVEKAKVKLDEVKGDRGIGLDRAHSVFLDVIQAFPLLGILGTIYSISVALGPEPDAAASVASSAEASAEMMRAKMSQLDGMMDAFATAIDSTLAGLVAAIFFSIVAAGFQPSIDRRFACAEAYKDMLSKLANWKRLT